MEEQAFDVMLNQLYSRVAETEQLVVEAGHMAKMAEEMEFEKIPPILAALQSTCSTAVELCVSIANRQDTFLDEEIHNEITVEKEDFRELSFLCYRAAEASEDALKALTSVQKRMLELAINANSQLRLELEEVGSLLRKERAKRSFFSAGGDIEEG